MQFPALIVDSHCHNAEGPLWHPFEECLYWTDIPRGLLFRYDPATGATEQVYSGEPVGGYTIQTDGALLLFKARGVIERWHHGKSTVVIPEIPDERDTRFNDVIADPVGRVYCGTMPSSQSLARLYRLNIDGSLELILENIGLANGMGFTLDRQQFYFTDSIARKIYRFDYDMETGELSNQTALISIPTEEGVPDGMTVDAQGHIWSARYDGSHLYRYSPKGTETLRLPFPTQKITSVTFGGSDYRQMYITTGGGDIWQEGGAGGIFHIDLDIQGIPEFFSQIRN
ncbi:MAG: SMP-30/gluconolactonase/LRE family protein [Cyanophyceae cyanobacterium]